MIEPTIFEREHLPVLQAAVDGCNNDPNGVRGQDIANQLGLAYERVDLALHALTNAGLMDVAFMSGTASRVRTVSGRAQELTGNWPTPETAFDRMIAALEHIADNTDDEDKRSRIRKLLDGFASAGRDIGVAATAAAIGGGIVG